MSFTITLYYKNDCDDMLINLTLKEARKIANSFAWHNTRDVKYIGNTRRKLASEEFNQLFLDQNGKACTRKVAMIERVENEPA